MPLKDKNECGILMHISSLASPYGIGTFGEMAYAFVDFLKECNQKYWQMLPLVPLGEGNSPYKSTCCFAGEPLYIDIDFLLRDGLLNKDEAVAKEFEKNVDFDSVRQYKMPLIRLAASRLDANSKDYKRFCEDSKYWLEDYAVFMAMLDECHTDSLPALPEDYKYRQFDAVASFKERNFENIESYKKIQYIFYSQFFALKKYANENGVELIGDIPFYVSPDSSDVWANPDCFCLDRRMSPELVAGVPPDLFSTTGQLWGNPIYNWDYIRETGYKWWKERLSHYLKTFDAVRIDHFRAFCDYYTIDYDAKDATNGMWIDGEGMNFWNEMKKTFGRMKIIAEDLGESNDNVKRLVKDSGFPNMKIIQFAFEGDLNNPHLPRNYNKTCVCYTGTHDNDTTLSWYEKLSLKEKAFADKICADSEFDVPYKFIDLAMRSKARTVIIPIQDYLELGNDGRMNTPGIPKGNWTWRMDENSINKTLADKIKSVSR